LLPGTVVENTISPDSILLLLVTMERGPFHRSESIEMRKTDPHESANSSQFTQLNAVPQPVAVSVQAGAKNDDFADWSS